MRTDARGHPEQLRRNPAHSVRRDLKTELSAEQVGVGFRAEALEYARTQTKIAVERVVAGVEVGMTEGDVRRAASRILRGLGATRGWHPILVRFGPNTTKAFKEPSDPGIVLGASDIFFVDVGPVFQEHEGDFGRTSVTGDDPDLLRCAGDSERIFLEVQAHWRTTGATGQALYAFADEAARARGWRLNLGQGQGHRVSEFPHAYHHRGKLAHLGGRPSPGRWILEIALRHPSRPFGSFYEDLLC